MPKTIASSGLTHISEILPAVLEAARIDRAESEVELTETIDGEVCMREISMKRVAQVTTETVTSGHETESTDNGHGESKGVGPATAHGGGSVTEAMTRRDANGQAVDRRRELLVEEATDAERDAASDLGPSVTCRSKPRMAEVGPRPSRAGCEGRKNQGSHSTIGLASHARTAWR